MQIDQLIISDSVQQLRAFQKEGYAVTNLHCHTLEAKIQAANTIFIQGNIQYNGKRSDLQGYHFLADLMERCPCLDGKKVAVLTHTYHCKCPIPKINYLMEILRPYKLPESKYAANWPPRLRTITSNHCKPYNSVSEKYRAATQPKKKKSLVRRMFGNLSKVAAFVW